MPYMTCLTTALFLTCTCAGITLLLYAVVCGVYLCRHHSAAVRCSLWRCSIHDTGSSSRTPKSIFVTQLRTVLLPMCVSVLLRARYPEHRERAGGFQPTRTPFLKFKRIRAVQQRFNISSSGIDRYNTSEPHISSYLVYIRTPVFAVFNMRNLRDFESTTSRRGTLSSSMETH